MSDAYANLVKQAFAGNISLPGDAFKMALLTSAYTPDLVGHIHYGDVSGHETAGTGYTAGGVTLTSFALTGPTAANSWGNPWAAASNYLFGDIVRPTTANGFLYMATNAGTSGGSHPGWPTVPGVDVADSGVTWVCIGGWISLVSSAAATWSAATFNAAYGAIYSTRLGVLVCLLDLGGTQSPASQNFEVEPDPVSGWLAFPPL